MLPSKWKKLSHCSTKLIRLEKPTTCTGLQAEQIFLVNIYYTYFSILGMALSVPLLCYFQKLQLLVVKKFGLIFAALYFYIYKLKKYVSFLKSYFKLVILIFLSFVVSFLVDMFNEKNISGEIWDTLFSKEAIENFLAKY